MAELQDDLHEAVEQLDQHYADLQAAARNRLGSLFNPSDYPPSLQGLFHVAWEFPSVEPPDYLRQLHPDLYEQECQRMQQRFDEAVQLVMQLIISKHGVVQCVYAESIDLASLGSLSITRGSHVEPDSQGQWRADLSPAGGPELGPFTLRSSALAAEHKWLESFWLNAQDRGPSDQ